ncbi:MAG: glycosyltransferase family 2 protein [Acidobacteriota bacterium]
MTRLSVIVPTAGRSAHLEACLRSLRADVGDDAEILLTVSPDVAVEAVVAPVAELCDHILDVPAGFAAANNHAFRVARGEYLACVNDDAIIEPGWSQELVGLLDRQRRIAAVQGIVMKLGGQHIDGAGIGWNSSFQAIQLGHGEPMPAGAGKTPRPVFGVSATAAVFRRSALQEVAIGATSADRPFGDGPFDERLFAYYEDVDLALRLHAAGHQTWIVPAARALHAGSSTGRRLPWGGRALIHGNRILVLARRLRTGDFISILPAVLLRDLRDAAGHLRSGDVSAAVGVFVGGCRALGRLPSRLFTAGGRQGIAALRRFPSQLDEVLGG